MKFVMRRFLSLGLVLILGIAWVTPALAERWITKTGKDRNGVSYTYLSYTQGTYNLSFSCNEKSDAALHMVLVIPSLPNLYAQDDINALLKFRFNMPGGSYYETSIKSWYYGGDKAWTGSLKVDNDLLNLFASAKSMGLRNPEGKKVLSFNMDGSAKAIKAVRKFCKMGLS